MRVSYLPLYVRWQLVDRGSILFLSSVNACLLRCHDNFAFVARLEDRRKRKFVSDDSIGCRVRCRLRKFLVVLVFVSRRFGGDA